MRTDVVKELNEMERKFNIKQEAMDMRLITVEKEQATIRSKVGAKFDKCMEACKKISEAPRSTISPDLRNELMTKIADAERKAMITLQSNPSTLWIKKQVTAKIAAWGTAGYNVANSHFMGRDNNGRRPFILEFNSPKERTTFLYQIVPKITDKNCRIKRYVPQEYLKAFNAFQTRRYHYRIVMRPEFPDAFVDFLDIALVLRGRKTKTSQQIELAQYVPTPEGFTGTGEDEGKELEIKEKLRTTVILTVVTIDLDLDAILGAPTSGYEVNENRDMKTLTIKCPDKDAVEMTYNKLSADKIINLNNIMVNGANVW